jgi:TrmH family RNA methyltransferase
VFVVEGTELVRGALEAGVVFESLYLATEGEGDAEASAVAERARAAGARLFVLAPGVVDRVTDTVTPQPLLGVAPMLDGTLEAVGGDLVVVCADVRDPGNAGSILRTADGAGAGAVIFAGASVDPFNPKTVRSSAGSLFHVPVVVAEEVDSVLETLGQSGLWRVGAVAHGGEDYATLDWSRPIALVLGNETAGLDERVLERLDQATEIPLAGRAESLNVGVACAVLCFEALRARRTAVRPAPSTMPG